ncbi:hypothetical protein IFM89_017436 [Coptis chinensis]|uniref:Agenet domain-containing protein n=1 Tax=Coptis chinensis TaxID=261450 RepID=A0A835H6U5_9MAGN|nr:hypothetical protein IFM89_017436 [Coptis chinensis]
MRVGGGSSSSSNFGKQNKQEDPMVTSPNSATWTFSPLPALLQSHQSSEVEKKENNKNGGNTEEHRTVKRRFSEEGKIATPSPQPFLPLPPVLQPLQSSEKQKNTNSGGNMEERPTVKRRFSEEKNRVHHQQHCRKLFISLTFSLCPALLILGEYRPKQAMDQVFSTGTPVEVSLPDKRCRGAWFPARVLKDIKNGSFLIEHSNLKLNEAMGCLKDVVHAPHVRLPPPQNFRGKSFVVKDKVDAFCDFVWWSGVVIEVLAGNHYLVKFQNQKKMRTFNRFELRCHMEWINGDWVQELREVNVISDQEFLFQNMGIEQAPLLQVGKTALSTDVTDESLTRKRNINHTTPTSDAQRLPPNKKSHKGEVSQATMGSLSLTDGSCDHPKLQVCQEKTRSGFDVDRSGNQIKVVDSSFSSPSTVRGELCSSTIQPQNNFAIASSAHSIETSGAHDINQQKGGVAGCQSKEDISEDPKLHIPCSEVNDVVHTALTSKGADIIVTGSDVETVQALSIRYGDSSCPVAIIDDRVSTDNQHTSQSITSIKA